MTKSTKSHQRERSPLFENSSRVHELVARAMRGECVRQRINRKSVVLRSPQSHTTTRANKVHEEAEQIRARKPARPHNRVGGREFSLYADGMELYFLLFLLAVLGLYLVGGLTHMRSMCVGVAETGVNTFLFLSFLFFSDKRKEL